MHEMSIKYLMSFKYLLIIRVVLFLKFLLLLYRHCNFEVQFYHIVYRIKFWLPRIPTWLWVEIVFCILFTWSFWLTLYTPTLISKFSLLFSIHSKWYWQGEFVQQSRTSLGGDHFVCSYDRNVCFRGGIVRRN